MFSRKKKDDDALPVEKGKEEIVPAVVPVGKEQDKKGPGKKKTSSNHRIQH